MNDPSFHSANFYLFTQNPMLKKFQLWVNINGSDTSYKFKTPQHETNISNKGNILSSE